MFFWVFGEMILMVEPGTIKIQGYGLINLKVKDGTIQLPKGEGWDSEQWEGKKVAIILLDDPFP